jgi:hypothetical protein
VFETEAVRQLLQPWIVSPQIGNQTQLTSDLAGADPIVPNSLIFTYLAELTTALQEIWLVGLDRADSHHLRQWQRLTQQGKAIGFNQFLQPIERFTRSLGEKFHTLDWDRQVAHEALAIITVLSQLAY